jgi:putative acetyltransferase
MHGLELLKSQGERIVIVVGHSNYYPRFGFSSAKATLLESPFPREAFMALELVEGAHEGVRGPVIYPIALGVRSTLRRRAGRAARWYRVA